MPNIVFLLFVILVLFTLHGYVVFKILPVLGLNNNPTILILFITAVLSFLPILPPILRMIGFENRAIDKFSLIGYTSFGFFSFTFMIFLFRDFFIIVMNVIENFFKVPIPLDHTKRDFLIKMSSLAILSSSSVSTVYGFYNSRKGPLIKNQVVFLKNLPKEFDNFTIAQISDLHVGPTIKKPYVLNVLDEISKVNPDMIAVTGDLIDGSVDHLKKDLEPFMDLSAPYGTYFVTGNHEYYSGVDQWLDETDRLGMINLVNSNTKIIKSKSEIFLAGITDYRAHQIKKSHRSNPALALKNIPKDKTKILLAHQPNSIYAVNEAGADLQLSGHTHGGQFWPFNYPTKLVNAYLSGLHNHNGTQIYVNSGTGYWGPPLRLGVPSEITLVRLKRKV